MKGLVLILYVIFSVSAFSCQNESVRSKFVDATVKFLGSSTSDGCGWVIEIKNLNHRPQNLLDEFVINDLEIEIEYTLLETKSACGFSPPISEIFIENIRTVK